MLKQENLKLFALKIRACWFLTAHKWSMKEQVPLCSYLALKTIIRHYWLNLVLNTCKQYYYATERAKKSFWQIRKFVLLGLQAKKLFWKPMVRWGSSGSIVTDYRPDNWGSIPDRQRIFLLAPASIPALGPTQLPVQWVPGVLSLGVKRGQGMMLTTHPHLVPRLRMSRSCTSSPPQAPPWHVAEQLYFYFFMVRYINRVNNASLMKVITIQYNKIHALLKYRD
jgi:hypothetical protein